MSPFTMRRTWPDDHGRENDFVFRHNGKDVGRCALMHVPPDDRWHWSVYGSDVTGHALSLEAAEVEFQIAYKLHRGL
jgi:hypothetical protein